MTDLGATGLVWQRQMTATDANMNQGLFQRAQTYYSTEIEMPHDD